MKNRPFSKRTPLYARLGISATGIYPCPFCSREFFGHALGAHFCAKAPMTPALEPYPGAKKRQLTEAEWRDGLEARRPKIGRAGR